MTDEEAEIGRIAMRLRDCIEVVNRKHLPFSMQNFPRGSCGDSALLLGAFLSDLGHSGFKYVCGERGSVADNTWTTHAWLGRGSLIVDITADQFADAPGPVIVAYDSVWHGSFKADREPTCADFRAWSGPGADQLHPIYAALRGPMLNSLQRNAR